jgi:hypothetical protein
MPITRRIIVSVEWVLIAYFLIHLVFMLFDLPSALQAQPCGSTSAEQSCYPWGSDGPSGEYWNYRSKLIYLTSEIFEIVVVALGLIGTWLLPPGRRVLALMSVIALTWLSEPILWAFFGDSFAASFHP